MGKKQWNPHTSVIVCGVESGEITPKGTGSQRFKDLFEAQKVFPDLDPCSNTERFTWAMGNPEKDEMRFETWAAEKLYGD
jgi:hypothetical protein